MHSPDAHADVVAAAVAPDVVGHLKPNDEDAQVQLAGPLAQGVRALPFVEAAPRRVIVGRVVLVDALTFSLKGSRQVSDVVHMLIT